MNHHAIPRSVPVPVPVPVLLVLLVAALRAPPIRAQFGPALVELAPASEESVAPTLSLEGTALPLARSAVGSPQAGRVLGIPVSFSQVVRQGDDLVQLDTTLARARVAAVKAEVEEARARHEEFMAGEQPETRAQYRAELAEAVAALDEARKNRDRVSGLRHKGVVTASDDEQATSRFQTALATRDAAQARLDRALAGTRPEVIAAQKAVWERHQARLAEAEALLAERTIRAPFDGEIGEVKVEVGDWVEAGAVVIDLVDRSRLDVTVLVPEQRIGEVRMGAPARVHFPAATGTEVRVAPVVARGPQTVLKGRTVPVVVRVANPEKAFYAGMSAWVDLPMGDPVPRILVPKDAVVRSPDGETRVYRVVDGKADVRPVTLGAAIGDRIIVETGLDAGEEVVVRGNERLAPGAPVTVAPPAPSSADGAAR